MKRQLEQRDIEVEELTHLAEQYRAQIIELKLEIQKKDRAARQNASQQDMYVVKSSASQIDNTAEDVNELKQQLEDIKKENEDYRELVSTLKKTVEVETMRATNLDRQLKQLREEADPE